MSSKEKSKLHWSAEEFRRHGHTMIDYVADYMKRVESFPVQANVEPGSIRAALPPSPPQERESFQAILADVEEIILPGITHWQSPNFFAYFPSNNSGPSILGDLLSSGFGVQGMLWATSPACTELETHVLDWLVGMLGLPNHFLSSSSGGGVIQDTASSAVLCALMAARERRSGFQTGRRGHEPGFVAYTSDQAHSSLEKAVRLAGFGTDFLRLIATDEEGALRPEALEQAIEEDLAAGRIPCFAMATVGTTSSLAMDPLGPMGMICQKYGIWFHVDAAMAGTAMLCPEFRTYQEGVERADSYCFNPHKWMLTNFDCTCFWVQDRESLIRTLSILPEYLRNTATTEGQVIDYRDWHIPLGRRFRALKLWFVIRSYGVEALQTMVRQHVTLSQWFAAQVRAHKNFEVVAPVHLNLVCFRHRGGDAFNEALVHQLNEDGHLYLTHTKLQGRYVIRMAIGQARTDKPHLEKAWEQIRSTAQTVSTTY